CWFYQTDGTVVIQIPIKGLKQEQVQVETGDKKVIVRIKISSSCNNYLIQFDLVRQINPLSSSYSITDSHIEIKLYKQQSVKWTSLDVTSVGKQESSENIQSIIHEGQSDSADPLTDWKQFKEDKKTQTTEEQKRI
ncbi:unnamed protein product, partial [Rotaria sp. Silwood2]